MDYYLTGFMVILSNKIMKNYPTPLPPPKRVRVINPDYVVT